MSEQNQVPVIEARDLRKTFGSIVAVEDVCFVVQRGECFGLLGPNGAGKTSTIRMTYGFSPLSGGSLRVFGLDIRDHWRLIRARLGVCQQENSLDPDLSVQENLEVFARYFDIPIPQARSRALELLRFVGLEHRSRSPVSQLSGGMMRRLVLARSLINSPELLILDEPTTGLDPQSRHQVWERLEALKKRGMSILITTHYMEEAARLCDRLIIMDHGRVLTQGSPSDLIKKYVGKNVIELSSPTEEIRAFIRDRGLDHEDLGHRLLIYTQEGQGLFDLLCRGLSAQDCILRMATLEDVFLKLTGRELRE
ncbi:MAG: ATP-binding cassette domain-containing protein [bacterium]